jgi:glycosyltransferase involved in cell wall biosynthesis
MSPPISLVITVYNRARYLAAAIDSILAQTYPHFELLIWDDGSSDTSVEIARTYVAADQRVRVIAASHQGRGIALFKAIAATTGKYFGWVDSDDLLAPSALAQTVAVLEGFPYVGMVYTDHWVMDEQGKVKGLGKRCHIPYSPERLLIDFMTFHFRLLRREVYEAAGGINPELEYVEDYDLCLRLSEITQIERVRKPLYYYRVHPMSISTTRQLQQIERSQIAIDRALKRRGLSNRYELDVRVLAKYRLRSVQKLVQRGGN